MPVPAMKNVPLVVDCADGGSMAYRKIEIRELPPVEGKVGVLPKKEPAMEPAKDYDSLVHGPWTPALTVNANIDRRKYTNVNGVIEIQGPGHAYDKSVDVTDVIVRTQVQKLAGQIVMLTLRDSKGVYYSAFYQNDGVEQFGFGMRGVRFIYSVKQQFKGTAPVREGEFFELAFSAVGDTLTVYSNGKKIGSMRDTTISRSGGVAVHAPKGKGVFKEVEYISLDRK